MIFVVVPFAGLIVLVAIVSWLLHRNLKRTTRASGVVVAKHFSASHGGQTANGNPNGGRAFSVPDAWVLEIDDDGRRGTAVVSQEVYESVEVGDFFDGEVR